MPRRGFQVEGTEVAPDILVSVGSVPSEVAVIARHDAEELAIRESGQLAADRDITELQAHELSTGEIIHLSVASFAILGFVAVQGAPNDGWFRKPGHKSGITTSLGQRIGGEARLTKSTLELCIAQGVLEADALKKTNGTIITNVRNTDLGRQAQTELTDYYTPRMGWIDLSGQFSAVESMVDEIGYMLELLSEEMTPELLALKNSENIDVNNLPQIFDDLDRLVGTLTSVIETERKTRATNGLTTLISLRED